MAAILSRPQCVNQWSLACGMSREPIISPRLSLLNQLVITLLKYWKMYSSICGLGCVCSQMHISYDVMLHAIIEFELWLQVYKNIFVNFLYPKSGYHWRYRRQIEHVCDHLCNIEHRGRFSGCTKAFVLLLSLRSMSSVCIYTGFVNTLSIWVRGTCMSCMNRCAPVTPCVGVVPLCCKCCLQWYIAFLQTLHHTVL